MPKPTLPPRSPSLEPLLERARALFHDRPVEKEPLIAAFAAGRVTRAHALDVAREMHAVVEAFPRFLAALLANDLDPALRDVIVDNLNEEQGRMDPRAVHLATYRAFLSALGHPGPVTVVDPPCVGVRLYIRAMLDLCGRAPVAQGAGALAVIEDHVARASLVIARWVARNYPGLRESHFGVHEVLDVRHAEELYVVAAHYADAGKLQDVELGVAMGTHLHRRLWGDLFEKVLATTGGSGAP
jgi:pyrroloquinoline quinone (PQQ) biosynthesis protein C